ncbi:MAG: VWA domain-containing protein [Butyrivibrio sp.]|nr:VWA domain-containing protein [Muribaculum sp.]MCM1553683.1 VWA domain-containing protein [Butyrivibrio sp.]
MKRRILSFILVLCLCMGMMPNANVYAAELQDNEDAATFAIDDIEANGQAAEDIEIDIPQNGSEVHIEDMATTQPASNGRRMMKKAQIKRYTVLVLDTSASMSFMLNGSPLYTADAALPQVKEASKKFVEALNDEGGDNYIAIVSYGANTAQLVSWFSNDTKALVKSIDSLYASGNGSVCDGLTVAERLIDSISGMSAIKNVVLFTTGATSIGTYSYSGAYNSSSLGGGWYNTGTNVHLYAYANSAYAEAEKLKEKCTLYSIGLFSTLKDMPEQGRSIVNFFKLCACDWASSKKHFYDVKDPANLDFVFGQVADNILKRTGTFSYPGKGEDYTATYYYDNDYFKESSYQYNQQLATMSLCLELSAWGSEEEDDYTRKMKNAEELLYELEFVGFDHNYTDFSEDGTLGKPTKDSVGVVAANKPVSYDGKDYTLIAVAVRGGGYEREWASNFTIGESGDHDGFSKARDTVITFLEEYIKEQRISGNIKIWLTGYSRAAATANMVAGALDKGEVELNGCTLELKDMFAYTFETPAGVVDPEAKNEKYKNIFNIINRNDLVPRVAPEGWDFTRYGNDRFLPSPEVDGEDIYKEKAAVMLEKYQELEGYEGYVIDDFHIKKRC